MTPPNIDPDPVVLSVKMPGQPDWHYREPRGFWGNVRVLENFKRLWTNIAVLGRARQPSKTNFVGMYARNINTDEVMGEAVILKSYTADEFHDEMRAHFATEISMHTLNGFDQEPGAMTAQEAHRQALADYDKYTKSAHCKSDDEHLSVIGLVKRKTLAEDGMTLRMLWVPVFVVRNTTIIFTHQLWILWFAAEPTAYWNSLHRLLMATPRKHSSSEFAIAFAQELLDASGACNWHILISSDGYPVTSPDGVVVDKDSRKKFLGVETFMNDQRIADRKALQYGEWVGSFMLFSVPLNKAVFSPMPLLDIMLRSAQVTVPFRMRRRMPQELLDRYNSYRDYATPQPIADELIAEELGAEEVFEREIKPLLDGASVYDIDELISLLAKHRASIASKGDAPAPIGASLVTTGLLRFNPLPKLHKSSSAKTSSNNSIASPDGRLIGAQGSGGASGVEDPLIGYDITNTLRERREQIKAMLNEPPVQSEQAVEAGIGSKHHSCRGGRSAAFRMRSSTIGSSMTGRHAKFY